MSKIMQQRDIAYFAHPLGDGPDRQDNRENAALWCGWLVENLNVAVIANWIVLSGVLPETPENRKLGLECDVRLIQVCDVVILGGGRISPGMKIESDAAIKRGIYVADFTEFGYTPPATFAGLARARELLKRPVRV